MRSHEGSLAGALLEDVTEKEWQRQVVDMATLMGFKRAYHTYDSRRSQSGFPDLVLVRDRVIFIELKRQLTGRKSTDRDRRPSEKQIEWLIALVKANAEVYIARPGDFERLSDVLRYRGFSKDWSLRTSTLTELGMGGRDALPP